MIRSTGNFRLAVFDDATLTKYVRPRDWTGAVSDGHVIHTMSCASFMHGEVMELTIKAGKRRIRRRKTIPARRGKNQAIRTEPEAPVRSSENPHVSVIVPVMNERRTLGRV